MSAPLALVIGAGLGIAAGALLIPLTRRALAASLVRAASGEPSATPSARSARSWNRVPLDSSMAEELVIFRIIHASPRRAVRTTSPTRAFLRLGLMAGDLNSVSRPFARRVVCSGICSRTAHAR